MKNQYHGGLDPNVTPLDIFLCGYVPSTVVIESPVHDLMDLRDRIQLAVEFITDSMLVNNWREPKTRQEKLWDIGGIHVDIY